MCDICLYIRISLSPVYYTILSRQFLLFSVVVNAESTQSTPHTVDTSITTAAVLSDSTETGKCL